MKRDVLPGLSIFAQADGSFVIWDPAKHRLLENKRGSEVNGAALIRLSRTQVWEGLQEGPDGRRVFLCEGLVRGWSTWQTLERARFEDFRAALEALSPEELLIPEQNQKTSPDEIQEVTQKLTNVLAQDDEFWPRWTYFARQQGVVL